MLNIDIAIIEDDKLYAENLIWFLTRHKGIHCTKHFTDAKSACNFFKKNKDFNCDIILLDIGLEHENGLDYIESLLQIKSGLKIIILSIFQDDDLIIKALRLGAKAYVSKKDIIEELIKAIDLVVQGYSSFSTSITNELAHHFQKNKFSKLTSLTKRQNEILEKFAEGKSYKQVAEELFIGIETVRSHSKTIYRSLKVKNKLEALRLFHERYK